MTKNCLDNVFRLKQYNILFLLVIRNIRNGTSESTDVLTHFDLALTQTRHIPELETAPLQGCEITFHTFGSFNLQHLVKILFYLL